MDQEQDLSSQTNNLKQENNREIKIRSILKLALDSLKVYKSIFWKLILMMLAPALFALAVIVILGITFAIFNAFLSGIFSIIFNIVFVLIGIFSVVIIMIVSVIAQTGLYLLIGKSEEKLGVKEAFLKAKKLAWKFFTIKLNIGLFTFLWTLLFIIPGLIMSIFYSFALWVFFYEGFTGGQSLKRSRELVKGYWWSVFVRYAGIALIFLLIIILPTVLIKSSIFSNLWGIITQIISFILTPFFIIYSQLIFKDLKKIKGESAIEQKEGCSKFVVVAVIVIVFLIVSLLSALAVTSLHSARTKAQDAMLIVNARQIQTGAELYKADNGIYPDELNEIIDYLNLKNISTDKIEYSKIGNKIEVCFILEKNSVNYKKGRNCLK